MNLPAGPDNEVVRIRLWNALRGSALLSECHGADRVLAGWAERFGSDPVRFEVTFDDGRVLRGLHAFFRKGRRTCRFGTHLQRILQDPGSPPKPTEMEAP